MDTGQSTNYALVLLSIIILFLIILKGMLAHKGDPSWKDDNAQFTKVWSSMERYPWLPNLIKNVKILSFTWLEKFNFDNFIIVSYIKESNEQVTFAGKPQL